VKVLSIDGGGIRGIIPAMVLAELEARARKPAAELFDLIAGTSTGGILAAALTSPDAQGRPRWTAAELVDLYRVEGAGIFERSLWRIVESAGGVLDEKHDAAGLDRALKKYLGEARLSQALTRVLVTSYDLESRRPYLFKSWRAVDDPGRDFPMTVVARATAAAPTYFEPLQVRPADGSPALALVDGGVFATNPGMSAYAEVRRIKPRAKVMVVSLGTGQMTKPIHYADAKDWGLLRWVRPIIDVVFDGVADAVDYELGQILDDGAYHRFQCVLDHAGDALDDASPRNIELLQEHGRKLIRGSDAQLTELAEALRRAR
jgi:patatin-like phospholipase/acyl hydrolase